VESRRVAVAFLKTLLSDKLETTFLKLRTLALCVVSVELRSPLLVTE